MSITKKTYLFTIKGDPPPLVYEIKTNGYRWLFEDEKRADLWNKRYHPKNEGIWLIDNPRYYKNNQKVHVPKSP